MEEEMPAAFYFYKQRFSIGGGIIAVFLFHFGHSFLLLFCRAAISSSIFRLPFER